MIRFLLRARRYVRTILDYSKIFNKMNENGVPDGDVCKRAHDVEDPQEPNKKLCTDGSSGPVSSKLPKKKKYAVLLGYNGGNYRGMQINGTTETIELELIKALHKAGLIGESSENIMQSIRFQRAARTDKTVSAAEQVISLIMSAEKCKPEDINAYLPPDIRIFSLKRVTKNFNSKGNCDARTYSYLLPTQALSQEPMENFLEMDYRISSESIEEINEIMNLFCGTHSFHNFTHKRLLELNVTIKYVTKIIIAARLFGDPSCKRYIMSFTCGKPFVQGKEFVLLTVKGQSFMLYQIRKMVGAVIAIRRGLATPDIIQTAFLGENLYVPIAPGEGLFLERAHFDKYNRRYGNDGIHEQLGSEDVEEEVMKFRKENIITQIVENELKNQIMAEWIKTHLCPIVKSSTRNMKTERNADEGKSEEISEFKDREDRGTQAQ